MENTQFKFLPRFADNKAKQANIVNFLESLDTSKKTDGKINNFEEFFLFSNLYNSCNEIMRNREILNDRDVKTAVHTIVSSSKTSNDLAYVAENIDGVLDSLRSKATSLGTEGNFEKLQETVKVWEETDKKAAKLINDLKSLVDENIEKGYGSKSQIRKFEYTKFEKNTAEVEKMLQDGKTTEEIASALDLRAGYIEKFKSEMIDKILKSSIENIKQKIADNVSRQEIADELKVSKNRLNKFIAEKKLNQITQKPAKDKKAEKVTKPAKATKAAKTATSAEKKSTKKEVTSEK